MTSESSFEWDRAKADSNLRKHGISFDDARLVFADPDRITVTDTRFDYGEDRFTAYGYIDDRLFAVVFVLDDQTGVMRLISARKTNARERKLYGYRQNHH